MSYCGCSSAVERYPSKLDVVGSIPILRLGFIPFILNLNYMKSVNDILAPDWFAYMDYLSGGDKVINYSWKKSALSRKEKNEIRSVLQEIDDLTGLSFVKTTRKDDDLRFIYTEEITDSTRFELFDDHGDEGFPLDDAILGRASARKNRIKLFIKDDDNIVDFREKYVLRHEIGHALGLSHPRGEGANPDFTSEDTVMSYNVYGNWGGLAVFRYFGFTDLDKQALQYNWGPNPENIILNDDMDILEDIPILT